MFTVKKQRADDNATVPGPWNQKETLCEYVIFLLFDKSHIYVCENKALDKKQTKLSLPPARKRMHDVNGPR